ncbi:MAG TPA: hypothetical protein ENN80_08680, partial [Candidatus Hydrogenedentes bacterium]|nr:hypothetical protein [Candidatus Hydrogenedentota bacterium]
LMRNAPQMAGFNCIVGFLKRDADGAELVKFLSASPAAELLDYDLVAHDESVDNKGVVRIAASSTSALGKAGEIPLVDLHFRMLSPNMPAVPIQLLSFRHSDQYGYSPRFDAPCAPRIGLGGLVPSVLLLVVVDENTQMPISGACVQLATIEGSTDHNGVCTFANTPSGLHTVEVSHRDYAHGAATVYIGYGETAAITIELQRLKGDLRVTVLDATTNEPIEGAVVALSPSGLAGITAGDGTCQFNNVAVGRYNVSASAQGLAEVTETVHIQPGQQTATLSLTLGKERPPCWCCCSGDKADPPDKKASPATAMPLLLVAVLLMTVRGSAKRE